MVRRTDRISKPVGNFQKQSADFQKQLVDVQLLQLGFLSTRQQENFAFPHLSNKPNTCLKIVIFKNLTTSLSYRDNEKLNQGLYCSNWLYFIFFYLTHVLLLWKCCKQATDEGPMLETLDYTTFYISICISTLPTQHTTFKEIVFITLIHLSDVSYIYPSNELYF